MRFKNCHVVITGGSSGIGKAAAIQLVQRGAFVSIIARTQPKLDEAVAKIKAVKIDPEQQVIGIAADVSDAVQVAQAIQTAYERIGPPSILITSAGISQPGYFEDQKLEIFERAMAVNYFGTLYCVKAVLPFMKQLNHGHIVMVASGAALIGIYGYTTYSPSKFAVRGLAESLRGELKAQKIRISIIYPPDTNTPQLVEENKTKPVETKTITGITKVWEASEIAREIMFGIEKKRFIITPGIEITLLAKLHSLISVFLNWYFDIAVAKRP